MLGAAPSQARSCLVLWSPGLPPFMVGAGTFAGQLSSLILGNEKGGAGSVEACPGDSNQIPGSLRFGSGGAFADVLVWGLGKEMRTRPFMGGQQGAQEGPRQVCCQ